MTKSLTLDGLNANLKTSALQRLDVIVANTVKDDDLTAPQTLIVNNNTSESTAMTSVDNRTLSARAAAERVATFLQHNGGALVMDICLATGYADEAVIAILKGNSGMFEMKKEKWCLK